MPSPEITPEASPQLPFNREDFSRPFTYAHFDNDPTNREVNQRLLLPTVGKTDGVQYILEVGCANGANVQMLLDEHAKKTAPAIFTSLDIDQAAIESAHRNVKSNNIARVSFVVGDATQLPIADETQESVYFTGIYHELQGKNEKGEDKQALALSELFRVLKPGGRLILVSAFTWETFSSRIELARQGRIRTREILGAIKDPDLEPFELAPNKEVVSQLHAAGFEVTDDDITIEYTNFTINSQRTIAEDYEYIRGTAQDWVLPEGMDLRHVRKAYHESLDEEEQDFKKTNEKLIAEKKEPIAELVYPRGVTRIIARKPELQPTETEVFTAQAA
jgi:ubiquinone/menaquinone biosynthesis C-methylase UbiE